MSTDIVNFMLHVDRTLSPAESVVLEDSVWEDTCVLSAHFSTRAPHLMLIAYDPSCTSMQHIHANLAERGINAQRVGL
ncbi:hypothetical protein [Sulfuriferula sp.]|uniref:hypothetical protein n=1 Tax=Sulfuriferula sp. TaxID=2025307 RepID=UPI0027304196|nr:hypothetical protein [Sulfuriferula sp.]MDP2027695.1 hypothetical protein [Sulfuriferula sp.]